ncbi:TetR/AcrR family transcriptional regulator [Pontibacter sp. HSC-36F09]|uniref:TetR/AcrR family transcriptional regulator n=1 Tax=Pontibacter sp. HSC-36F09 TaxID=2910966 RepID=UPI0020A0AA7E|nr:TetR/AcrR family transcriptional regulator [Pontibacter sp. HSC-36F09]MCP2045328.1 AcrR family transcriptional regulator [Pontibacter sp. HSC-36F09]
MKERIINQAVKVFNRKGISKTTLRAIARELAISDGHLRYYFKTKEELVLATFSEMEQEISSFAAGTGYSAVNVQTLVAPLTGIYRVMYRYVFFFAESSSILETFPKVYTAYEQLMQNRRRMFLALFEQYRREGVFEETVDDHLFPLLFEQVFILSDSWVRYARLPQYSHLSQEERIEHYVAVTVALFLPHFNPELRKEVSGWLKQVG